MLLLYSCPSSHIRTTNCKAINATNKMKEKCDGKQSCTIAAINSVFGDPCVGTFKYMEINYDCRPLITEQLCEHQSKTISCGTNEVIKVAEAFYGRSNRQT